MTVPCALQRADHEPAALARRQTLRQQSPDVPPSLMTALASLALPLSREQWYNAVRRSTATARMQNARPMGRALYVTDRVRQVATRPGGTAIAQSGGLCYETVLSRSMAAVSLSVAAVAIVSRSALPMMPMAVIGLSAETVLLPSPLS